MLVLHLLGHALAIHKQVMTWPKSISEGRGQLGRYLFREQYSSESICVNFFAEWWSFYWQFRSDDSIRAKWERDHGIVFPDPVYYHPSPVQSIDARVYGRYAHYVRFDHERVDRKAYDHCMFGCEDLRAAIELWINDNIVRKQTQVRDKGWARMRCPEGHYAVLKQVPDRREEETDYHRRLDALVRAYDPSYFGPATYPSTLPISMVRRTGQTRLERTGKTETVQQCDCMPATLVPVSPLHIKTACRDLEVTNTTNEVIMSTDEDISDVLVDLFEFWVSQDDVRYTLAGPASSFNFPGQLQEGTHIRGCAHAESHEGMLFMNIFEK